MLNGVYIKKNNMLNIPDGHQRDLGFGNVMFQEVHSI